MPRPMIAALLAMATLLCAATASASAQTLDAKVDQAIERGLQWVWSIQKPNGMFSGHSPTQRTKDYFYYGDWEVMAMTALAYGGVAPEDPRIKRSLKTLLELKLDRVYVIGFRVIALAEFYRHAKESTRPGLRAAMKRDAQVLLSWQNDEGSWHYYDHGERWDFSNTQIALLALREAALCGVEIDRGPLQKTMKQYLDKQRKDGGWNYGNPLKGGLTGASYGSMTAAAVANLYVLRDLLNPGQGCPCRGGRSVGRRDQRVTRAIERGTAWLGPRFSAAKNPGHGDETSRSYYWLYSCERVGINSGLKYFAAHNWYAEGAREILSKQAKDGSWAQTRYGDTTFALLFLIKGRGPILMNKLQYDGSWDIHPRDAANLAAYVGRIKEQRIAWQVIHLGIPVGEMHDSPILYITAERAVKFTDAEKKTLRDFTDTGGTILAEASCGSRAAKAWWPRLCKDVWPEWELETIDRDHGLWSSDVKMTRIVPGLQGLDDGMRTFVFFAPRGLSCRWHTMSVTRDEAFFKFGNNLYAYATDRGKLRGRLARRGLEFINTYGKQDVACSATDRSLTVARLAHAGRWHLGRRYKPWQRLTDGMKKKLGVTVTAAEPAPSTADVPAEVDVLHVTGREALVLDEAALGRVKAHVARGGWLLAEATMGEPAFDASFREIAKRAGWTLEVVGADDPLLSGKIADGVRGLAISDVGYTFSLRAGRIGQPRPLVYRIQDGKRTVGVYSPFDLVFASTGCKAFGNRGYAVADARALLVNVVLSALVRGK